MGGVISTPRSKHGSGEAAFQPRRVSDPDLRRNGASDKVWNHARSEGTVGSLARLEALANVAAQVGAEDGGEHVAEEAINGPGCRLAYSSVLVVKDSKDAQSLLAHIFTIALTRNPLKEIGGMLFYDEKTCASWSQPSDLWVVPFLLHPACLPCPAHPEVAGSRLRSAGTPSCKSWRAPPSPCVSSFMVRS